MRHCVDGALKAEANEGVAAWSIDCIVERFFAGNQML